RARAQRRLAGADREREERGPRVLVLDVAEDVDRDALLARVAVGERVEQRLHGARAHALECGTRILCIFATAMTHALHEREREVPVDLDEQAPIHLALRIADRERQELLLERLERPFAEV